MRPWERERGTPPPDSPPKQTKGSLSSMVVKPSEDEIAGSREAGGGGGASEAADGRNEERRNRDDDMVPHHQPRSRRFHDDSGYNVSGHSVSPPHQERPGHRRYDRSFLHPGQLQDHRNFRDGKYDGRFHDFSPIYERGRSDRNFRDISPPYGRGRGGGRFRERSPPHGQGRGRGGGRFREPQFGRGSGGGNIRDLSPPYERERGGRRHQNLSPRYEGGRGRGRIHDLSPPYERDRGGRRFRHLSPPYEPERRYQDISTYDHRRDTDIFDRNFNEPESELLPTRDESVGRNNPNIPPRVGDWICRNPSCGNINFARREYCNNCNKFRYEPIDGRSSGSPRRGYLGGALPLDDPPPRIPSVDRGILRETNGYRSPPRSWARDVPRDVPRDPPPLRHGGRFSDAPSPRDLPPPRPTYHDQVEYRTRSKFDRPLAREWDRGELGRGEFLQEKRGYDRDQWTPRERSRSPIRDYPTKDARRDSFVGRGRGDRRGMGRGRTGDVF